MRILPIAAGVLLVAGIAFFMRPVADVPVVDVTQAQEEEAAMAEQIKVNVAARFGDAPEGVAAIAETIMLGQELDPTIVAALSPEELNASYSLPFPEKQPLYGHTLLREAVVSGNVAAAGALVAAGANPAFNDNEMPHIAVKRVEGNRNLAFGDYATGNALVQVWLDAGGDPNVHNAFYGGVGPLLVTAPMNNLEGLMLLLKAGADPWGRVSLSATHKSFTFMSDFSNANLIANEVMFRLANDGLIGPGPAEEVATLIEDYERVSGNYVGSTGPANLATMWRMQKAIGALYPVLDATPAGDTAVLMSTEIPADVAGFWLAEGETRSPETDDQVVTSSNQEGDERWDG